MSSHHDHAEFETCGEQLQGSPHSHHHRSKWRNIAMAVVQAPLAIYSGSFALAVAGSHNFVDGKVHDLRHKASETSDPTVRKNSRLKSAGLLALAGAGAFTAEKLLPTHTNVQSWVISIFAGETVINAIGYIDSARSSDDGVDTMASKMHNASDTLTSGATTLLLAIPHFTNAESGAMDQVAGFGHLGLMGAIALYSASTANKT